MVVRKATGDAPLAHGKDRWKAGIIDRAADASGPKWRGKRERGHSTFGGVGESPLQLMAVPGFQKPEQLG